MNPDYGVVSFSLLKIEYYSYILINKQYFAEYVFLAWMDVTL